jgi:hypothetical protein
MLGRRSLPSLEALLRSPFTSPVVYVSGFPDENLRLGLVKTGVSGVIVTLPLGHRLGRSICHVLMLACLALHLHRRPGVCVALWLCLCGLGVSTLLA